MGLLIKSLQSKMDFPYQNEENVTSGMKYPNSRGALKEIYL